MRGLEPPTFCMANARCRSGPFAPVRSNHLFAGLPSKRTNTTEPERTPNLAILATESGVYSDRASLPRRAARSTRHATSMANTPTHSNPQSFGAGFSC
jgi:hypothetical protein